MVLEKTLESPLDFKEIQPVHLQGDQPWDFFGGSDAVAETLVNQHSRQIKLRGGATPYCARGGAYTPPPLVFNSHPALSLNLDSFESPERVC